MSEPVVVPISAAPKAESSNSSYWLALLLPYVFQAFVLLLLTAILVWGEASPVADAVISALLVVGTGSAIAGGSTATAHIINATKSA